jgi:hypothetical protein
LVWLILVALSDFCRFADYNRMQSATGNELLK